MRHLLPWILGLVLAAHTGAARAQGCAADLDANGAVTVDEVVSTVNLAHAGCASSASCPGDDNHDRLLSIGELTAVVYAAFTPCAVASTSTPTRTPTPTATSRSRWTPGVYKPSMNYAARCTSPRVGTDPFTGEPFPDVAGSVLDENDWLRSWTRETYLWYSEVPDLDPAAFTTADYFDRLRTSATTASGRDKDRFHFAIDSNEYYQLTHSGAQVGYGVEWITFSGPRFIAAYTEPNSPATGGDVGLERGAEVLAVDGVRVSLAATPSEMSTVLQGLYPTSEYERHSFTILDRGSDIPRVVQMEARIVDTIPVPTVRAFNTATGRVGYLLFHSHIATAEAALIDAMTQLRNAGINDLVLDLRYNTGGYVVLADEVAYMIAGPNRTRGRVFQRDLYNDQYASEDLPFVSTAVGLSADEGTPLPSLNLGRVFVLTGSRTCSASESIINSLRGIDVEVIQIGATTCGKPYVFFPEDNCGTTYFTIQVQAVNAKGFGAYDDGFSPQNISPAVGTLIPGCAVGDDFSHLLGDPGELRLAIALYYRTNGSCPPTTRAQRGAEAEMQEFVWDEPGFPRHLGQGTQRISRTR